MPTAHDLAMAWEALRNVLSLILSWSIHALAIAWGTALAALAWPFANMTSANWAAVAAMFAALSSFLTFLVQRRNLLESARPELMLLDWTRSTRGSGNSAHEVISFRTIKNVGRGAAYHININCGHLTADRRSTASMGTIRLPILAAGESTNVEGEITVWFQNVEPDTGGKSLFITIETLCWDSRSIRHETQYNLRATEDLSRLWGALEIAPGVARTSRVPVGMLPVWWLRLRARLARFGRLFRRDAD